MAGIKDHDYLKVCAELASCLSISISAASKKVELAAAKQGVKDYSSRKKIAEMLLKKAKSIGSNNNIGMANQLDNLLKALAEEENFLVED